MRQKREFNILFQAFDQSAHARDPLLALLLMWSSLESMFSPARTELRFRVSRTETTVDAVGQLIRSGPCPSNHAGS